MDSVLKISLSIEYHTKSDPPLVQSFQFLISIHPESDYFLKSVGRNSKNYFTKGGSDLVWYSIDRDIFKTESFFCIKKSKQVLKELLQKN